MCGSNAIDEHNPSHTIQYILRRAERMLAAKKREGRCWMDYLMSGRQTLVGIALLVLWRVTLFFFSRRNKNKPLS